MSIKGLPAGKSIRSATLTGPRGCLVEPHKSTALVAPTVWEKDSLSLSFTYWAPGSHRLDITFDDDTKDSVSFTVPVLNAPLFQADLHVAQSNVRVLHKQEPEYTKVMTSCLKNLLRVVSVDRTPEQRRPPSGTRCHWLSERPRLYQQTDMLTASGASAEANPCHDFDGLPLAERASDLYLPTTRICRERSQCRSIPRLPLLCVPLLSDALEINNPEIDSRERSQCRSKPRSPLPSVPLAERASTTFPSRTRQPRAEPVLKQTTAHHSPACTG